MASPAVERYSEISSRNRTMSDMISATANIQNRQVIFSRDTARSSLEAMSRTQHPLCLTHAQITGMSPISDSQLAIAADCEGFRLGLQCGALDALAHNKTDAGAERERKRRPK
jgi:hypothetical protein